MENVTTIGKNETPRVIASENGEVQEIPKLWTVNSEAIPWGSARGGGYGQHAS